MKTAFRFDVFHDLTRSLIVERRVVYRSHHLARCLITQREEMREIILTEGGIVAEQSFLAPVFLGRRLVGKRRGVRDGLDALAMLLPLFECQFLFCCLLPYAFYFIPICR